MNRQTEEALAGWLPYCGWGESKGSSASASNAVQIASFARADAAQLLHELVKTQVHHLCFLVHLATRRGIGRGESVGTRPGLGRGA